MPWERMTTEDKLTIIIVVLIGLIIIFIVNLISFGILQNHDIRGMKAKHSSLKIFDRSFIISWILAIFFCLLFWFGMYRLLKLFVLQREFRYLVVIAFFEAGVLMIPVFSFSGPYLRGSWYFLPRIHWWLLFGLLLGRAQILRLYNYSLRPGRLKGLKTSLVYTSSVDYGCL